ncbi:hypothetical protein Q2K19_10530 [Micromonospora soli]|uniref:LppU/SCO3897 family protein n=1 Tax=Micromonospora sp. NBRC 110009 TaxID=3061627 RepID=UPI00267283D9|nr:hypothetical protein [Micromonospora sp. NBRC 110009]WKU00873.1 hypothetical protein Q2K19_10530 [Micromonospora sp. NBRC 110009]
MTSEVPHRPGQEPGDVTPGGAAPYGDRPAPQDNGYPGTPDLGWAPPPPAARPASPAPAWAAPDEAAPPWTPGGQPANRGSAQVPPPAEPDPWAAAGQPAWATGPSAGSGESSPAWGAAPEQAGPAWAAGQAEPPAWGQPAEPGARGAAQVPAPATVPHETWATPAPQQDDDPGRSGGWQAAPDPQPDRSGGWAVGAAAQPQDDPNRSGGWTPPQDDQPAWGQQGDQAAPAWAPAEPPARASAKVSVPGAQAENPWPTPQDDPVRSGGWESAPAGGQDDDPDRSGGWAAGRAAGQVDRPQQTGWDRPEEQHPGTPWTGAAAVPQQRDQEEPAPSGWSAGGDRPEAAAWGSAEAPARASASVPSPDSPPAWGGNQDNPAPWTPQRPAIPEAQPWSPAEAWGHPVEAEPAEAPSNTWEPTRAEEPPVYQPAPGPGISPANAMPLPPQEQRVPGAALAASPPDDYLPPAQFAPTGEPADRDPQAYEPERAGAAWGAPEPSHEEPQSSAGSVVPGPRTSPEAGGPGSVSASASVPLASRVMPPTDQGMRPAGAPAPQPRVYGRPIPPEPEEAPGHGAPNGYPGDGSRFDEPGPEPRADEPEHPVLPNDFAEAPPAPSSPAGPPPFPPGVPSFVDPAANNRPMNGVHPHNGERPGDPFGAQRDPFGAPAGQQDPFAHQGQYGGAGGQPEPFGGPAGGRASVAVPGQGPGPLGEPGQGGFPPAFPPPPQQAPPTWQQGPANNPDQGRFDAFRPDAEPKTEAPAPKVRNGRVLALVLLAAVLILAVPLGALALLGKLGGDDKPAPFDPAVGSCIKQSGTTAATADCAEPGAFKVVSRVDSKDQCADPAQPSVELKSDVAHRWVCLQPVGK